MKATVKQLATITFISLLLMVLNVKAEGTETIATASSNENMETALVLENWMTDETIWNTNRNLFLEIVPESETELGLEAWMTNSESWNISFNIETEKETGMELENWMTSDSNWFVLPPEKESGLQMEDWMTNDNVWK